MNLLRYGLFVILSHTSSTSLPLSAADAASSINANFIGESNNSHECVAKKSELLTLSALFRVPSDALAVKIIARCERTISHRFLNDYVRIIREYQQRTTFTLENDDCVEIESPNCADILRINDDNERPVAINATLHFQNAVVVLTDDEKFLTNRTDLFIKKPRTTATVVIMMDCFCKRDAYVEFLKALWETHAALNVWFVAQCDKLELIGYNPFAPAWNRTDSIDIVRPVLDKLRDLHGYTLRTSMFDRSPTAISLKNVPMTLRTNPIYAALSRTLEFAGYDGYVLANLARYMNFTINLTSVSSTSNYGRIVRKDNTRDGAARHHTGTLGQLAYKRIDISGNGMFVKDYDGDENLLEFTVPVNNDRLCIVVPKAQEIPQWTKMFRCFQLTTWLMLLVIALVCVAFWLAVNGEAKSRGRLCLDMVGMFLTVSVNLSTRPSHRIFLAFCMSYTVIITSIFQGSMVKSYSTRSYYADIDSLEKLDESGLLIATSLDVFTNRTALMASLAKKRITLNVSGLLRAAYHRDVAAVERKDDANLLINTVYKRPDDGYPLLHLMKECPSAVFIAYIVPYGSPFRDRFDRVLYKFGEAGLLEKWYGDVIDALLWDTMMRDRSYLFKTNTTPFNIEDVKAAFCLLVIGHSVASAILLIEMRTKKSVSSCR